MIKKIYKVIFLILLTGCSVSKNFYVANVQDLTQMDKSAFIYALPRTVVTTEVTAIRHVTIPGPYHEYADEFLGIKDVPHEKKVLWTIDHATLDSHVEVDPDYYYSVKDPGSAVLKSGMFQLTENGLILDASKVGRFSDNLESPSDEVGKIPFTDLSVKRNIIHENDTIYKKIVRNNSIVRVPMVKKQWTKKTLEEKAEEAANFIVKLRKRRFKLLTGQSESIPGGEGMEAAIEELNDLEAEYLALFTGKTTDEEFTRTFQIVPEANRQLTRTILFRFSETDGFFESNDETNGKPIVIEITDRGTTKSLEHLAYPYSSVSAPNVLFYRIPDRADIRLIYGSSILAEADMNIYQHGAVVPYILQ